MITAPQLIISEKTSRWSVALRRLLPAEKSVALCETRTLDACWAQTLKSPWSLVVLEVTWANVEQIAKELGRYQFRFPRVRTVVVGNRQLAAAEWLMREQGAIFVAFSTRHLTPLRRIFERQCEQFARCHDASEPLAWRLPWAPAGESQCVDRTIEGALSIGPTAQGRPAPIRRQRAQVLGVEADLAPEYPFLVRSTGQNRH